MKWTLALALGFVLAGCEQDAPPAEPAAAPPVPAVPVTAQVAEPPALSEQDVAVPEDFIEEATTEITADNYAQKLEEIEKEVLSGRE